MCKPRLTYKANVFRTVGNYPGKAFKDRINGFLCLTKTGNIYVCVYRKDYESITNTKGGQQKKLNLPLDVIHFSRTF